MVRLLLYEWCCSGGLPEPQVNNSHTAFIKEGRMMLEALAVDAARDKTIAVTVLVGSGQFISLPVHITIEKVPSRKDIEFLIHQSQQADYTIIVAPETDGILTNYVTHVREQSSTVIAPGEEFLRLASDKQQTVNALAAFGVPVPAGRILDGGEVIPEHFYFPAICKSRASAGCDTLSILHNDKRAFIFQAPVRLERYHSGVPVGVSCLCGNHLEILPPMLQHFSNDPSPRYVRSEPLKNCYLVSRAQSLARRSIIALEKASSDFASGWIGVDMILGTRTDGSDDRVLEVNPRLTSSFVEHSRNTEKSLVRSMIDSTISSREATTATCH